MASGKQVISAITLVLTVVLLIAIVALIVGSVLGQAVFQSITVINITELTDGFSGFVARFAVLHLARRCDGPFAPAPAAVRG